MAGSFFTKSFLFFSVVDGASKESSVAKKETWSSFLLVKTSKSLGKVIL